MGYDEELGRPFEHGIRSGELRLPRCRDCGSHHWYPLRRCPHCHSARIDWVAVAPTGTVFTWTRVNHRFSPEDTGAVPYVVALIELPEAPGVRLISELPGNATPQIGMTMTAVFDPEAARPRVHFIPT